MGEIYTSDYISITREDDILIQEWTKIPLNTHIFQQELLDFLEVFKCERPESLLWLQENFDLEIPNEIYEWVEKFILEPQYKAGLRTLAITVPKNQYAHLSIVESFNDVNSIFQPKYFNSKEKALAYLKHRNEKFSTEELSYTIERKGEKTKICLEVDQKQLPHTLKHLKKLNAQFKFKSKHQKYFDKLTLREFEVFKSISFGMTNKEIASALIVSELTVATHRKSLIKKLKIKSATDWQSYANAFL